MGAGHRVREGLHLRYTPVGQRTTNSLLALARGPDASIPVYTFCVPMSSSPTFSHGPPSSTPAPPTTIRPKRPRCSPSSRLPPLSPFLPRDEPIVDTPAPVVSIISHSVLSIHLEIPPATLSSHPSDPSRLLSPPSVLSLSYGGQFLVPLSCPVLPCVQLISWSVVFALRSGSIVPVLVDCCRVVVVFACFPRRCCLPASSPSPARRLIVILPLSPFPPPSSPCSTLPRVSPTLPAIFLLPPARRIPRTHPPPRPPSINSECIDSPCVCTRLTSPVPLHIS